jgi:hypothetical protein
MLKSSSRIQTPSAVRVLRARPQWVQLTSDLSRLPSARQSVYLIFDLSHFPSHKNVHARLLTICDHDATFCTRGFAPDHATLNPAEQVAHGSGEEQDVQSARELKVSSRLASLISARQLREEQRSALQVSILEARGLRPRQGAPHCLPFSGGSTFDQKVERTLCVSASCNALFLKFLR